jgi:hypothetical protein
MRNILIAWELTLFMYILKGPRGAKVCLKTYIPGTRVESYGYEKILEDAPIHARICMLMKGRSKRGTVRRMLLKLLKRLINEQVLETAQNIVVEALGQVQGKFSSLIELYKSMGFRVVAFLDAADEHKEEPEDSVLMLTTVGNLVEKLEQRFGSQPTTRSETRK